MASGKIARGLKKVPQYTPPVDEADLQKPQSEKEPKKKKKKFSLFSLGQGLDMPLFVFILVLLAAGLVMLFSASYAYSYYDAGSSYNYILKQGAIAAAGLVMMLLISTFDYHRLHFFAYPILVVSIVLLILVLALKGTPFAPVKGDANRWLAFGPISFQPSEVAKFAMILVFAHMISQKGEKMKTFRHGVLPFAIILGVIVALVALENHLSAILIIGMLAMIMMLTGGTRLRWFVLVGAIIIPIGIYWLFFTENYQLARIQGWFHPFDPPEGVDTYQTRQSLYAIGSGGFLGQGLGQSRQKYLYLPAPHNDFIFAVVCEELGFVGAIVIMLLFALLIWRGVYVSINARDKFGMMLGLGITFLVGLQAVLNICVVTNTLPNTGISLPFFSYGGTALLMLLAEMGVLLNISRSSNVEKT